MWNGPLNAKESPDITIEPRCGPKEPWAGLCVRMELPMKAGIHPAYEEINVVCACGHTFKTRSAHKGDIRVEICSSCHPFFTGKQKLIDTEGRVDRFQKKYQKVRDAQGRCRRSQEKACVQLADSYRQRRALAVPFGVIRAKCVSCGLLRENFQAVRSGLMAPPGSILPGGV